jgi:hypothetical protein
MHKNLARVSIRFEGHDISGGSRHGSHQNAVLAIRGADIDCHNLRRQVSGQRLI